MARHGFGDDGIDEPTPPQGTPQYGGRPPGGSVYGGQPQHPTQFPPPRHGTRPEHPTQQFPSRQYPNPQYPNQQHPTRQYPSQQHPTQQFGYPGARRDDYRDEAGYDPDGSPSRWNARVLTAVALSVVLVIGLGAAACAFFGPSSAPGGAVAAGDSTSDPANGATTSDPAVTPTPTPTPKATAKATPKATKPTVKVTKRVAPPPPPPPAKSDSPSCITYLPGTNASPEVVQQKLEAAAGVDYFNGVIADPNPPPLSISPQLLKAVAFVESSWRSTVIACDDGVGLMQIMKPTQDFVNQRFGHEPGLDRRVMDDNITLGAHYLEYLLYFFGVNYFENTFDWDATVARGPHGAELMMRDLVIAAYNYGPEGMVADRGATADRSDDTLYIPNHGYVDKVLTAVETSPWTAL